MSRPKLVLITRAMYMYTVGMTFKIQECLFLVSAEITAVGVQCVNASSATFPLFTESEVEEKKNHSSLCEKHRPLISDTVSQYRSCFPLKLKLLNLFTE